MITITQNKIAGFEPRWAPFSGFSLLFDNPGVSTTRSGNLLKIDCLSQAEGALELYFRIEQTLNELDRDLLLRTYLFCPLPPSSYHVTVWDGINVDNISSVRADIRTEWTAFLQGLPNSLGMPPKSMAVVAESNLARNTFGSIGFRFEKLTIWGNQVLVARLRPAGQTSEVTLKGLVEARTKLCEDARKDLGVSPSRSYSPHVSLGYFANQEHGQLAHAKLENWTERFRNNLEKSVITYASLDTYAFTDMASFFKLSRSTERHVA